MNAANRQRKALGLRSALFGQIARRLSWGIADQGISSITNFAVSIYVARSLGDVQFGAFSLAYVTYPFVLNASRGLATDPLMVRFSAVSHQAWRRAVAECTGTALVVGLAAGVLVLAATSLLHGYARLAFLGLGVSLPGLMLQDSWRFAFFALGSGSRAFINDCVWAVTLVPGLIIVQRSGHANVFWFVLVWGMSATIAAAGGLLQAGVVPKITGTREWLSKQLDLGIRFFIEGTATSAGQQLRSYGVGFILSLAAVGYIQAANTIMGPIMILFLGMGLVTTPEAARILQRSPRRLPLFCMLVSAGLVFGGLVWGGILVVVFPRGLGQLMLGQIWRSTYPLAIPQTLYILGMCVVTGASAGLHALGAAQRSMRGMTIMSAMYLALGILGAVVDGTTGAVLGTAIASWSGAVLYWWELRIAMREYNAGARSRLAAAAPVQGMTADPTP
jgi:O-antigen/teichoic acid export membrane protein